MIWRQRREIPDIAKTIRDRSVNKEVANIFSWNLAGTETRRPDSAQQTKLRLGPRNSFYLQCQLPVEVIHEIMSQHAIFTTSSLLTSKKPSPKRKGLSRLSLPKKKLRCDVEEKKVENDVDREEDDRNLSSNQELGLEVCPVCQFPFKYLTGQSARWHVSECTEITNGDAGFIGKMIIDFSKLREQTKGVQSCLFSLCQIWRRDNTRFGGGVFLGYNGKKGSTMHYLSTFVFYHTNSNIEMVI